MTDISLVLGVDGGGTKSLGLIATLEGNVLARREVGASNPNVVGHDGAANNLYELIALCCTEAHCTPRDLGSMVFGLAGAGDEANRRRLIDKVNTLARNDGLPPLAITIDTDARIALEGAFDGGPGVVVIAGTGSVVMGKTPDRSVRLVGGWGRVLGDEGSGYFIGLEAIKAVTRDFDGRGSSEFLRTTFAANFGWSTRERVIAAVYRESFNIPSLAPVVLNGAAAGDKACLEILQGAAVLLARQVEPTVRLFPANETIGVVLVGGLIDHETVYARVLSEQIHSIAPRTGIRRALHTPAHGAVFLAQEQLRKGIT